MDLGKHGYLQFGDWQMLVERRARARCLVCVLGFMQRFCLRLSLCLGMASVNMGVPDLCGRWGRGCGSIGHSVKGSDPLSDSVV